MSQTWIVDDVHTTGDGNVYVDLVQGDGTAPVSVPIAVFPPAEAPKLRRGRRVECDARALRDQAVDAIHVVHIEDGTSLYEALHIVLDYCESEGLDPQMLGDAVALYAVSQQHEGRVQSMLEAGGWDEPQGAHPQRMSEPVDRTKNRVRALAHRMLAKISEGRRWLLSISAGTRASTGEESIGAESIRLYQEQSTARSPIVAVIEARDEPNPAQFTLDTLVRDLRATLGWYAMRGEDGTVRIWRPGWASPIRILAEHLDDVRYALAAFGRIP